MELAQNAADAAARAGVEGRLLLRLVPGTDGGPATLLAANTGAPLDAAGVEGLATLRASAKRDDGTAVVGRFGVGFSAVLAVSDEPAVAGRGGGVRFSRTGTLALLEERCRTAPGLAAEVARRGADVPVLRLPFPVPASDPRAAVPEGYDTLVTLPLRDAAAAGLAQELLAGADDVLLLALPALREVVVELPGRPARRLADVERRWRTLRRSGRHSAEELAGRGSEDRSRPAWELTWAVPRAGEVAGPGVLCAPTPTDEPLPWPAVLLATLPLQPDRRHVLPGPATEVVLDAAARAYVDLLVESAADADDAAGDGADADPLDLLPPGVAASALDASLRERVLALLPDAPVLRAVAAVEGVRLRVRPRDAVVLDGAAGDDPAVLAALAPVLPTLVAAPRRHLPLLRMLDVARTSLADVVEELPTAGTAPAQWRRLYAALRHLGADPSAREALAALPVPLADGRVVRGPRGLVQLAPGSGVGEDALAVLAPYGLRVVHPEAADELLERLGARAGGPWMLLTDEAVRTAVADSPDADDPDVLAEAVLELVAAHLPDTGAASDAAREVAQRLPWLGDLALPDADDELAPASALVLPGSVAARVLDPAEVAEVHPDLLADWGPAPLLAVGVLADLGTARLPEVAVDAEAPEGADPEVELPAWEEYLEHLCSAGAALAEEAGAAGGLLVATDVVAVRDLDLVRRGAWAEVVPALCAQPAGRQALLARWPVTSGTGAAGGPGAGGQPVGTVLGHAAWWLRHRGPLPPVSRAPGASPLLGWLDPAPEWAAALDPQVRVALGVLDELPHVDRGADPEAVAALVVAAADPARRVSAAALLALWRLLARHARHLVWDTGSDTGSSTGSAGASDGGPPHRLRVLDGAGTTVAAAADVLVADSPAWAQRHDLGPCVLVPAADAEAVADVLDVDLASERAAGTVDRAPAVATAVPAEVEVLLPGAPRQWWRTEELRVDGAPVGWWSAPTGPGEAALVHARTPAGAACGLALAAGRWELRHDVAALLTAPDAAARAAVLAGALPG
ncbi:hypothetical protein CLV92_104168 [Kineococcus xinjiangensis]|uniref:ATP-binding protein n=1 Tax=Kineococcus xinjiangensis TaxID=512762 RepID=A0A2S6ISX3_9ACTN|nr:hypothetical protein [Kineococcus xinjiangensis]PPK97347.1 hypothetical protein CLV92_104168 [Kineococcus xinjiangensis]